MFAVVIFFRKGILFVKRPPRVVRISNTPSLFKWIYRPKAGLDGGCVPISHRSAQSAQVCIVGF